MGFARIKGLPGRVFVPEAGTLPGDGRVCADCLHCQGCGPNRCRLCRGEGEGGPGRQPDRRCRHDGGGARDRIPGGD